MKAKLLPKSIAFQALTILCLLVSIPAISQDTVYRKLAVQSKQMIECPKLEYEFVFCRKSVSCEEMWSKALLQDGGGKICKYPAGCKSHMRKAKGLTAEQQKDLLEQQRLIREKGYELWLEQYKLELIRVDIESLARGIRTPPMW
jgi:hypothetical protein